MCINVKNAALPDERSVFNCMTCRSLPFPCPPKLSHLLQGSLDLNDKVYAPIWDTYVSQTWLHWGLRWKIFKGLPFTFYAVERDVCSHHSHRHAILRKPNSRDIQQKMSHGFPLRSFKEEKAFIMMADHLWSEFPWTQRSPEFPHRISHTPARRGIGFLRLLINETDRYTILHFRPYSHQPARVRDTRGGAISTRGTGNSGQQRTTAEVAGIPQVSSALRAAQNGNSRRRGYASRRWREAPPRDGEALRASGRETLEYDSDKENRRPSIQPLAPAPVVEAPVMIVLEPILLESDAGSRSISRGRGSFTTDRNEILRRYGRAQARAAEGNGSFLGRRGASTVDRNDILHRYRRAHARAAERVRTRSVERHVRRDAELGYGDENRDCNRITANRPTAT